MAMSCGATAASATTIKFAAGGLRALSCSSPVCSIASGRILSRGLRFSTSATSRSAGCGLMGSPRRSRSMRVMAQAGDQAVKTYNIVTLPGDGIGPEIMSVAVDVLRFVGDRQSEF
jgi:hypothetical protein